MFIETFDAAIDSQESLSTIETFFYWTRHLEEPAADCVRGFSLKSKSYIAREFLRERFGNTQVIISAHMKDFLNLSKLNNNSVVKLTSFFNAIESNLQSLMTMGPNLSHYGPLLMPVILESLPGSTRQLMSRKSLRLNF